MTKNITPTSAGKASIHDLVQMVQDRIKSQPFEFNGYAWAAVEQRVYAQTLGMSEKTIMRWSSDKTIFTKRVKKFANNARVTLLRVGEGGGKSEAEILASRMCAEFFDHIKAVRHREEKLIRTLDPATASDRSIALVDKLKAKNETSKRWADGDDYGCFINLIPIWGPDKALAVLTHALRNWRETMVVVKLYAAMQYDAGEPGHEWAIAREIGEDEAAKNGRFWRYASPSLMRKYPRAFYDAWDDSRPGPMIATTMSVSSSPL